LRIKNFRCLKDIVLNCERLTILIGPNGSGKSSFLRALELFYNSSAKYTEEDFYNKNTAQPIIITVTFSDFTDKENKLFNKYIEASEMTVEKVITWPLKVGSQKYYGTSLQNPDFDSFRMAKGTTELRSKYRELKDGNYSNLPDYTNKEEALKILQEWEANNQQLCIRRQDDGQFFGFREVGESHLERYTQFISIPAVREASEDAVESRGSPLTSIMDLVVRSVLAQKEEITKLREDTQEKYGQIIDSSKLKELKKLESELGRILKIYIPNGDIKLLWTDQNFVEIPLPRADIKILEDEYLSSVDRTGHGTQRAFILTMLHYLTVAQASSQGEKEDKAENEMMNSDLASSQLIPNLIIGIEEPELYQHPNRQRYLYKTLLNLSEGSINGVAEKIQIIYSTHSPLFVDIIQSNKIRVLSKVKEERDAPKYTKVIQTNLDKVAEIIEKIDEKPKGTYTGATLEPRLKTLMTPWMNEGFFAKVVVLVEGEEDRAIIMGMSESLGYDLESKDISVIPCMGKGNLDKPSVIFSELEIPIYVIWDSDYDNKDPKKEINHRLLRFFNQSIEDWPEKVEYHFACFRRDISFTLRSEIGVELYDQALTDCCNEMGLKRKEASKNPKLIQEILSKCLSKRGTSKTIEEVIKKINLLIESKI
jgi:AAA15 family ATPase/GTPase